VRTKDSCWSVGTIYDPTELPEVSTADPGLDGVLHSSSTPTLSQVRARTTSLSLAIRPQQDSSHDQIQQLQVSASVTRHSLSYIPSL
jgi:hypothetical protein